MWLFLAVISTVTLAIVSILNSIFVHNYVKSPLAITWIQSCISLVLLLIASQVFNVNSTWMPWLVLTGITAYAGDLCFFHVLGRFDTSVQNASWAILSLLLSIFGFVVFHESWTIFQSAGAALIIGGTLMLSLYHKHINIGHTLLLFFASSALYVPYYVMMKAAADDGQGMIPILFWLFVGREFFSILTPLIWPSQFKSAFKDVQLENIFFLICFITVSIYFVAEYLEILALSSGPISLVALVTNIQPFVVMGVAWLSKICWPSKAPKELLTHESIKIKLYTFSIVFIGLALIGIYQ